MITLAACTDGGETDNDTGVPTISDAGLPADGDANTNADAAPDAGLTRDAAPDAGITADTGTTPEDSGTPPPTSEVPRAVRVAKTTAIPACTVFVDPASTTPPDGTATNPYTTLTAAVAAANDGAIICAAEGTYAEALSPGLKYFTLAGGFQSGQSFTIRDSSIYVSKAQGDGTNIFLRIEDEGPTANQLTAVDGFEITGYSQGIYRIVYYSQRFDITNNYIHDNTCADRESVGGGFALNNISGTISGNVFARNTCGRGAAGGLFDSTNSNTVTVSLNRVDANIGNGSDSHGGGLYLFTNNLTVTGNEFTENRVNSWGGGLYVGAEPGAGFETTATISWNIYRGNRAEIFGGGFFCDDGATCISDHEIYEANCGGNLFVDSGPTELDPTIATFDHLTNYGALDSACSAPGPGVIVNKGNTAVDVYTFTNSIFWNNLDGADFAVSCLPDQCNATVEVTHSLVQTNYMTDGIVVTFGAGISPSADPRFADVAAHDFHLRSRNGRWTPTGYVNDAEDSPALAAGDPAAPVPSNPDRAGTRTELGAYGNSAEASYVR